MNWNPGDCFEIDAGYTDHTQYCVKQVLGDQIVAGRLVGHWSPKFDGEIIIDKCDWPVLKTVMRGV